MLLHPEYADGRPSASTLLFPVKLRLKPALALFTRRFEAQLHWQPVVEPVLDTLTWTEASRTVARYSGLVADRSLTGAKVAAALTTVLQRRATPAAISVDNGTEFVSKATDAWAYAHGVRLDFIRPGRPVENAFIESFNGRLRDECLNSHVFGSVAEAQSLFDAWRRLQSGPTA